MADLAVRVLILMALWFGIVLIFAFYGWFGYGPFEGYTNDGPFYTNLRFEPSLGFGSIGVGTATCLVIGILVVGRVRTGRLARKRAALLLCLSTVLATVLPALIVWASMVSTRVVWREPIEESFKGVHLFQGEDGWWIIIAPYYSFWIALFGFVAFIVCVFGMKKPQV